MNVMLQVVAGLGGHVLATALRGRGHALLESGVRGRILLLCLQTATNNVTHYTFKYPKVHNKLYPPTSLGFPVFDWIDR